MDNYADCGRTVNEGRSELVADTARRERTDWFEGDIFGGLEVGDLLCFGLLGGGFEVAIDRDVGELIETGIGFHARSRGSAAFDDFEIMREEADAPFEALGREVVLQGVGAALRLFDKFAVGYAIRRPLRGEVIRVEFVQSRIAARGAHDDTFAALLTDSDKIQGSTDGCDARSFLKIAHAFGVRSGFSRQGNKSTDFCFYSGFYDIFQVP